MLMTNCLTTILKSQLTRPSSPDLLQGCSTQLDGDVSEEAVSLCAEISDDVRVCVRRSEKLHLALCYFKTLRKNSLHRHVTSIKFTPTVTKTVTRRTKCISESQWFVGEHTWWRTFACSQCSLWLETRCHCISDCVIIVITSEGIGVRTLDTEKLQLNCSARFKSRIISIMCEGRGIF